MLRIPVKTIERFSLYRRILREQQDSGRDYIYSYSLAELSGRKPAQVRRDLSYLPMPGSSSRGYRVRDILAGIGQVLDSGGVCKMALVGIGHMGKAFINFFKGRGKNLEIAAAFDIDPAKTQRVINGCRCYHLEHLSRVVKEQNLTVGIITTPEEAAEDVYRCMAAAGIKAIINIAPVPLKGEGDLFIENLDLTTFFEKAAYHAFANKGDSCQ